MDSQKVLTISIASYNVAKYLDDCVESFINSTVFNELEIIIVDDGSSDNTLKIAQEYEELYPDVVKVIAKENGGHGSTINASIKASSGKYFKVVDADDWVDSKNLEKLISYLKESTSDLVLNPYYEVAANDKNRKKEIVPYDTKKVVFRKTYSLEEKANTFSLAMHAMSIRTQVMKEMGPAIDEHCFYVDTEYTIFPFLTIESVTFLEYPIYNYLLGTATQSMNMSNMQKRRDQHLKVCKRLVSFYEDNKNSMKANTKSLIKKRIASVVIMQYVIYIGMNSRNIKDEFISFDKWLKKASVSLYNFIIDYGKIINSGYLKIVPIIRATNYAIYVPIVSLLQLIKGIK